MNARPFYSWGRLKPAPAETVPHHWTDQSLPTAGHGELLAFGLGRSYGDSCQLEGGKMISAWELDRLLAFDEATGELTAEAGVTFDAILRFAVPRGWFLPTTPGTRFVTLGGAIANDVHGKNHHVVGTIGHHITRLQLHRSDGTRLDCAPGQNEDWLRATIGGLGLTGLITKATLRLTRVRTAWIDVEYERFAGVPAFSALTEKSAPTHEHTVAWLDCLGSGSSFARGIFMRGNSAAEAPRGTKDPLAPHSDPKLDVPINFPSFTLNHLTVKAFNALYYARASGGTKRFQQHYAPFFYPLDGVNRWNRIYGKAGFYQYQCVIPRSAGPDPMEEILRRIARSGQASFLAVLKVFGDQAPPGLLSFPRAGMTLALDFPNRGASTLALFEDLDDIVRNAGGRLYPAKDARMRPEDFRKGYPELEKFNTYLDPAFSSDFWKRMHPKP
jgi:FAD/FMN-containing dehydrogenase